MLVDQRRENLLELVRQQGFATLPDLATALEVSESTIRRDLDHLEDAGSARRTHGGVFYTGPSPKLDHFELRHSAELEKKQKIAAAAAELIRDGETVLLDGGSTTYELARLLVGRSLQIVTNSLPVANLLMSGDSTDLVLIGGYVLGRSGVTVGPYADQMLSELNVQRAVLSVAGANERGYYNSNLLLVETERRMMQSADETIIVADSTKFGRSSLARMCGLAEVERVVVDAELDDRWREQLRTAEVDLIVADE